MNNLGSTLLDQAPFKNSHLQSRIAMAPMTRMFSPEGIPGEDVASYYAKRATNGVGLIITEGTAINHPAAVMSDQIPRFHGDDALQGWNEVVFEVHRAGGKIIPQLWHVGAARKAGSLPNPEAAPVSLLATAKGNRKGIHELTASEIEDLVKQYANAAKDAKDIGFDGIELHGAHGYLIDQFFWSRTNHRTDRYGGTLEKRMTFAIDIVRACRAAVGPEFPIVFRFSQWKGADYEAKIARNSQELSTFLKPLVEAGVDIFHCSTRRIWEAEFPEEDSERNLAAWTKHLTGKPVIAVGSIGIDRAYRSEEVHEPSIIDNIHWTEEQIRQGHFDYVAIGRSLLADAAWPTKLKEGQLDQVIPYSKERENDLI
ncbi:LOW QUALITY PROTEIN: 2,4-dienoyl-CoA reductase [Geomicrobium sp. JCM 19037]|nr:LOW QUALITY PROTEIN: 2,4-dienoyl-CoA reductase [Geomicrobium sp. JCM 19037]